MHSQCYRHKTIVVVADHGYGYPKDPDAEEFFSIIGYGSHSLSLVDHKVYIQTSK